MNVDDWLCQLPLIGWIVRRMYTYFKKHIAFTDFIHICGGLGLGLIIGNFLGAGIIFLLISILGHIYAFSKGKQ